MQQRDPFFGRPRADNKRASGFDSSRLRGALAPPAVLAPAADPAQKPAQDALQASSDAGDDGKARGSRLIVGPSVRLKSVEIADCDTLVVEGHVEATMDSHNMEIAAGGAFCGTASIDVAVVEGVFSGELTVRKCLTIRPTGKVSGKIRYCKLVIEEGGEISGDVKKLTDDDRSLRVAHAATNNRTSSPPPVPTHA